MSLTLLTIFIGFIGIYCVMLTKRIETHEKSILTVAKACDSAINNLRESMSLLATFSDQNAAIISQTSSMLAEGLDRQRDAIIQLARDLGYSIPDSTPEKQAAGKLLQFRSNDDGAL